MTANTIRLARASADEDPIRTFAAFHETIRDVAAWMPTLVDDTGSARPRDARWLRAFLSGPLAWHICDEEEVLIPRIALRESDWLHACLTRVLAKHRVVDERAQELARLLEPLCGGDPVSSVKWTEALKRFTEAVEDSLRYEDDIILPSAHVFLDRAEVAAMSEVITTNDDGRSWAQMEIAGDAPLVRPVHAVRVRGAAGLDVIIRSFASCPRGGSVPVGLCASCPHLEELSVGSDGKGTVGCAIDCHPVPSAARVSDFMTRDVVCIVKDAPIAEAVRLMASSSVTGLPVVDERGRPVGVISQTDIIAALADNEDIANMLVADVMMHAPIVVGEESSLDDARRLILIENVQRLVVINADHAVVGILSTLDLVRATAPRGA